MKSLLSVAFLTGCVATSSGTCPNPVHDACSAKAAEMSVELSKIADQQHSSLDQMTTEFVGACEGQLNQDLDQVLPALRTIADAGTQP